jgi:hypothetical protein
MPPQEQFILPDPALAQSILGVVSDLFSQCKKAEPSNYPSTLTELVVRQ